RQRHGRDPARQPQQVRVRPGPGRDGPRPHPLLGGPLPDRLRLRPRDARGGRRPARRAHPGRGAGVPRLPGARAPPGRPDDPQEQRRPGAQAPRRAGGGAALRRVPRPRRHPAAPARRDRALLRGLQAAGGEHDRRARLGGGAGGRGRARRGAGRPV
ncbi:MAG: Inorganic pyrophosphatase, partial [uncultured Thermomicrobiales bacterium]